jgi:hypothetical protein
MIFAPFFVSVLAVSPFAPLLQENAEWRYSAYTQDAKGKTTDLDAPGEIRLKVVLVREVGKTKLVVLQPQLDGVEAQVLRSALDLQLPFAAADHVLAISDDKLRAVELTLDAARTADEAAIEKAATNEPLVFPATPKGKWVHHLTYDDGAQTQMNGSGTLSVADGVWTVKWTGKQCLAGDCDKLRVTQAYSPEQGFTRLCTPQFQGPSLCLKLLSKEDGPAKEKPKARPTLGAIYRRLMQEQPAVAACLRENDVSILGFTVTPGGALTNVEEKNQSGKAAACTVKAIASVHFEPFDGAAVAVEKMSFSK